MSKRGADEYITKEHGTTVNSGGESLSVKMATAAQMAKRKLATPKGRLGSSRGPSPSPFNGAANTNPFGQPSPDSSEQQQQQQQPNGGFSFGVSQSFPTTNSESSGFNFQPPQSASFTFGATPTTSSNPFASMNGSANGNTEPAEDMMMESPQKKPMFGTTFAQSSNPTANGSTGFSFGQPVQQQPVPSFSFGGAAKSDDQNKPVGGLFGNIKKSEEPKPNNLFGQGGPVQPSFGGFGSSEQQAKPTSPSFDTGTSQPFSFSGFNQPSKPTESVVNGTATNSTVPPQSTSAPFSFGQPPSSVPAAPSQPTFSGFGTPQTDEPKTASTLFGQPAVPLSGTTSHSFGSSAPENQSRSVSAEQKLSEAPVGNPFAGLFSASQSPSPQPTSPAEQPVEAPKAPTFSFGASSSMPAPSFGSSSNKTAATSSTLFGNVPNPTEEAATPKFSFGSTATPQFKPVSSQMNGPTETTEPDKPAFSFASSKSTSVAAEPPKPQNLFSHTNINSNRGEAETELGKASSKPQNLFGASTSNNSATSSAQQSQKLFGVLSSTGTSTSQTSEQPRSSPFGNKASTGESPRAVSPEKPAADSANVSSSAAVKSNLSNPQRPVYTKSPARIPNYLNGEGYKEYDTNYRLRSLNRELQKRIATLDPELHDFENIIRHYVAARDSIGASLGLYIRNVAGSKRKNDDGADKDQDVPPQYKRARPAEIEDTAMNNTGSQVEPSVPASTAPTAPLAKSQPSLPSQKSSGASRATEVFKSMIPTSPSKSTDRPNASTNVFASIKPQPVSTPLFGAPKPTVASKPESTAPPTSNIFGQPSQSTTPIKSPPKKPVFEMPKPVAGGFGAFGSLAQKSAKDFEKTLKEKRKAEDFDSDEDDEAEFEKNYEEEQQKKKAKLEGIVKTGFAPTFSTTANQAQQPAFSFGAPSKSQANQPQSTSSGFSFGGFKPSSSTAPTPTSTFSGFKPATNMEEPNKAPVNVSDDDEGEEDDADADGEGEDSEYQPGSNEEESEEQGEDDDDDLPEDEVPSIEEPEEDDTDDNDLRAAMERHPNKGKSLFDRVSAPPEKQTEKTAVNGEKAPLKPTSAFNFGSPITQPAPNQAFKSSIWGSNIGKSTPEAPEASPITPASTTKEPYKPATTFNFTPTPHTSPPPTEGASIFSGGSFGATPAKFEGMFGSRPSTPSNVDKNNIFGQPATSTPVTDHTWKPGSAIKFGTSDKSSDAPTVNITAPSPGKDESGKSLGNLFGNSARNNKSAESAAQLGFSFGAPNSTPAPGYLGAAPHLGGGSGTTSGFSSRATSPGLTDNESVATNESEEAVHDPQTSLMDSRAGEENEDCIWESRAKAIKFYPPGSAPKGSKYVDNTWNTMGVGQLRVLKDRNTGKTRIVLRADPGASIIINQRLVHNLEYEQQVQGTNKGGAVKFPIMENGALWRWVLKLKTDDMGKQLSDILENNKSN